METEPESSDLPWQRIKLEIANGPSSSNEPRTLSRKYDVIPHGYEDTAIRVETREGILADKLVSFPATLATYVRWRDIWDMRRLRKRGVSVETALVRSKVEHCRIEEFSELLAAAIEKLPELVTSGEIAAALNEFLEPDTAERTLRSSEWLDAVAIELRELLIDLQREM